METRLVSTTFIRRLSAQSIALDGDYLTKAVVKNAFFDVEVYFICYKTVYKNQPVTASAVLYIPQGNIEYPLLSLQHGTLFCKSEAPSKLLHLPGFEILGSLGYVVLQPDYLGYGNTSNLFHPYYDYKHSATVVIDCIEAAKEFLHIKHVKLNDNVFMAGFSEGGYVTLAAQKEIENRSIETINLKAVAAGAGGYDLFEMLGSVTTGTSQHVQPAYIAFLLLAYEQMYGWNKPLDYYFSQKYAAILPELFSGNYASEYINAKLSTDLKNLFNPQFYSNLTGSGEMELKKALYINSLSNWAPTVPLRLYHGTRDETIPLSNTEATYRSFLNNKAADVKFIPIVDGTHNTTFEPMLLSALDWFKSYF